MKAAPVEIHDGALTVGLAKLISGVFATVVTGVGLYLLAWGGSTLIDIRDKVSRLEATTATVVAAQSQVEKDRERMTRLEEAVASIKAAIQVGTDDRFRGSDWRTQERWIRDEFSRDAIRMDKVEGRLSAIEREQDRFHSTNAKTTVR